MGNQLQTSSSLTSLTDRTIYSYNTHIDTDRSFENLSRCKKTITINNQDDLDYHKNIFNFRLKNKEHLTYCHGFQIQENQKHNMFQNFSCKSPFSSIKIAFYYEEIFEKFSNIYQISITEGIKILSDSLTGFTLLFDKFGYFTPQTRLVMKQGGQWKVWINQNVLSIRNRFIQKKLDKKCSKTKFLQQVVHLFDSVRDSQCPQFSYTNFIYGTTNSQFIQPLSLDQIQEKLRFSQQQMNCCAKIPKRMSLKRISIDSNATLRKGQCGALISTGQQQNNEVTLEKFWTNKDSFHKNINNISTANCTINDSKLSNIKQSNIDLRHRYSNSLYIKPNFQNEKDNFNPKQIAQSLESQNHTSFKRVSSKLIRQMASNDNQTIKQIDQNKHYKNRSSISTPSNCTGWIKQFTPLKNMVGKQKQNNCACNCKFRKKQRSYTVDLSSHSNSRHEQEQDQLNPRKITENSQRNSQSEENQQKNTNFKEAFLESQANIQTFNQNSELPHVQIISKNPSNKTPSNAKTPSIAHKTKKCGQQTMKFIKQYLMKSSHKRSFTDNIGNAQANKIKFCWSQQFDSAFFSNQSYKQNPNSSKEQVQQKQNQKISKSKFKEDDIYQQEYYEPQTPLAHSNQIKYQQDEKKAKKVKIVSQSKAQKFQYGKDSDLIHQQSQSSYNLNKSKQASIDRLPIFKSQGGLKSLLINKLSTLKSIKQIDVQVPIDQQILRDLNKIFPKHRFAKSTKLTK